MPTRLRGDLETMLLRLHPTVSDHTSRPRSAVSCMLPADTETPSHCWAEAGMSYLCPALGRQGRARLALSE